MYDRDLRNMTQKQEWWKWHKLNPNVYELFKKFTFEAIDKGHTRFSHWLVMNRIRWETSIDTVGDEFKIRNDFIAYYARLFMHEFPEHNEIFAIKKMKEDTTP
jgi:hypothetical protein